MFLVPKVSYLVSYFLVKNGFLVSIKVASSESFLNFLGFLNVMECDGM